jgi:DNA-binding GntR family transcriptional regulator
VGRVALSLRGDVTPRLRYEQVIDLIEHLITDQGLQPGDALPTNKELAKDAGVSLISVRRALDELERAGRVRRHQGVGTFVAAERILAHPSQAGGLLATLTEGVASPQVDTRLLGVRRRGAGVDAARALAITVDDPVWEISRLRVIGARAMISETSVIPLAVAPDIDTSALRGGHPLYAWLADHHGLVDVYEEQYLDVTLPGATDRKLLGLSPRDRVVRIRGVSYSNDGQPFDRFQQVYPTDGFAFYLSGQTDRQVLPVATRARPSRSTRARA